MLAKNKKNILFLSKQEFKFISTNNKVNSFPIDDINNTDLLKNVINKLSINGSVGIVLMPDLCNVLQSEFPDVDLEFLKQSMSWELEEKHGISNLVYDFSVYKFIQANQGLVFYSNKSFLIDLMSILFKKSIKIKFCIPFEIYFKKILNVETLKTENNDYFFISSTLDAVKLFAVGNEKINVFREKQLHSAKIDFSNEEFVSSFISFIHESVLYAKRYNSKFNSNVIYVSGDFIPEFVSEMIESQIGIGSKNVNVYDEKYINIIYDEKFDSIIPLEIEKLTMPLSANFIIKSVALFLVFNVFLVVALYVHEKNYNKETIALEKVKNELSNKVNGYNNKIIFKKDEILINEIQNLKEELGIYKYNNKKSIEIFLKIINDVEESFLNNNLWVTNLVFSEDGKIVITGKAYTKDDINFFIKNFSEKGIVVNSFNIENKNDLLEFLINFELVNKG